MIDHQDAWQVFAPNGAPLLGESITPDESRKTSDVIVGAVHVWMWRHGASGKEVLLQKRAATKPTWPGCLDISVAGHIDAGETLFEAVRREASEEVGCDIDTAQLDYIFGYRNFTNGLKWVYFYELREKVAFVFNDGEVEELQWVQVDELETMTSNPAEYNLVPHPSEYYSWLISALRT